MAAYFLRGEGRLGVHRQKECSWALSRGGFCVSLALLTLLKKLREGLNLARGSHRNSAPPRQRTDKAAECYRGHLCGHVAMKTTGVFLSMGYLWTGDWETKQGLPQAGNGMGSSRIGHLFLPTLPFNLTHLKATPAARHHLELECKKPRMW